MKNIIFLFFSSFFIQFSIAQTANSKAEKEPAFSKSIWVKDGLHLAAKSDVFEYYFDVNNGNLQDVKVLDKEGNEVPSKFEIKSKSKGKSTRPILIEICTSKRGPNGTIIYICKLVKQL